MKSVYEIFLPHLTKGKTQFRLVLGEGEYVLTDKKLIGVSGGYVNFTVLLESDVKNVIWNSLFVGSESLSSTVKIQERQGGYLEDGEILQVGKTGDVGVILFLDTEPDKSFESTPVLLLIFKKIN